MLNSFIKCDLISTPYMVKGKVFCHPDDLKFVSEAIALYGAFKNKEKSAYELFNSLVDWEQ